MGTIEQSEVGPEFGALAPVEITDARAPMASAVARSISEAPEGVQSHFVCSPDNCSCRDIHPTGIAVRSKHHACFNRAAGLVAIYALRPERGASCKVGCRDQGKLPADEEPMVLKGRSQGD